MSAAALQKDLEAAISALEQCCISAKAWDSDMAAELQAIRGSLYDMLGSIDKQAGTRT